MTSTQFHHNLLHRLAFLHYYALHVSFVVLHNSRGLSLIGSKKRIDSMHSSGYPIEQPRWLLQNEDVQSLLWLWHVHAEPPIDSMP